MIVFPLIHSVGLKAATHRRGSKNMIIANRKQLLNGNSFILGLSGSGKSFTANCRLTSR
jgi:hypothetical protein